MGWLDCGAMLQSIAVIASCAGRDDGDFQMVARASHEAERVCRNEKCEVNEA
jgi:hypothetical protein